MRLRRATVACVLTGLLVALLVADGSSIYTASAQVPSVPPPPNIAPSPSPSNSPSASPSQDPSEDPPPSGQGSEAGDRPPSGAAPVGGLPSVTLVIPDIPRSRSQDTGRLVEILAPLAERGIQIEHALVLASAPFPVAGHAWFSDDFGFARYTPLPHLHEGNDIFADLGTPIVASGGGVIGGMADTAIGGISLWVAGDDGHGYYYAHLQSFADGLQNGQRVQAGTLLGYVGTTGNAVGTSPHLHFEVYPPVVDARRKRVIAPGISVSAEGAIRLNSAPVNPKPYLDEWLRLAEGNAHALVEQILRKLSVASRHTRFERRADELFTVGVRGGIAQDRSVSLDPSMSALTTAQQKAEALLSEGGSLTQRSARRQRIAAIRLALEAPKHRFEVFTGSRSMMIGNWGTEPAS